MRFAAVFLLALLAPLPTVAQAENPLWTRLKSEPGLVVLTRHTHARGGHPLKWDESGACAGETVLTTKGKDTARRMGEAFSSRGIKPAVISSPMCRCRETSELAFPGAAIQMDPALIEVASADSARMRAFETKARAMIAAKRGPSPVVFVSHTPNIDQLTMELLAEDVLLVGKVDEKGEIEVLGKITLEE